MLHVQHRIDSDSTAVPVWYPYRARYLSAVPAVVQILNFVDIILVILPGKQVTHSLVLSFVLRALRTTQGPFKFIF